MIYRGLYFGFNIYNKKWLLLIYYQVYKNRVIVFLKAISTLDFNILFIYFQMYYYI